MAEFFQEGPSLGNQFDEDFVLKSYLERVLPARALAEIEPGLRSLGRRAVGDIQRHGDEAEAQPPRHVPYDPWGRRIDHIEVSPGWTALTRIAAEEAIVATGYKRAQGPFSRIHQAARIHLFNPPSAIFTCPLAMTDGAARLIELYGDDELKNGAYRHLTSTDPDVFWTSGQWMTERTGGSDVSGTATVARLENGEYRLHGTKFFTSATTSDMAMTLARIEGAPEGSKGLSLFYLELRDEDGRLNNIEINRLKEKLGTKALPTAELTLKGAPARLVSGEGNGVKKIASLFNITRVYNSICAVSYVRRGLALARDYAHRRWAFGRNLDVQPLHVETLAQLEVEYRALFALAFRVAELLGKDETRTATRDESAVLRLLTPVTKLFTARRAVSCLTEVIECFGGAGYMEDTGIARLLRDTHVLPIWEGTTNVLSLDAIRAIEKEGAFPPFVKDVSERLEKVQHPSLADAAERVRSGLDALKVFASETRSLGREAVEASARNFALSMARIYTGSLLCEAAEWHLRKDGDERAAWAADRWCQRGLLPGRVSLDTCRMQSRRLAMES